MADVKAENQSQLENSMFHECATHCLEWDEVSRGIRARSWVPTIFITAQVGFFLHTHTHTHICTLHKAKGCAMWSSCNHRTRHMSWLIMSRLHCLALSLSISLSTYN